MAETPVGGGPGAKFGYGDLGKSSLLQGPVVWIPMPPGTTPPPERAGQGRGGIEATPQEAGQSA